MSKMDRCRLGFAACPLAMLAVQGGLMQPHAAASRTIKAILHNCMPPTQPHVPITAPTGSFLSLFAIRRDLQMLMMAVMIMLMMMAVMLMMMMMTKAMAATMP